MQKKILAISFSQTGQLDEIIENFLKPFQSEIIERVKFEPASPYPMPWDIATFFDTMPETVNEEPMPLKPIAFANEKYDLVILGYQPWFLSPSRPTSSLLQLPAFQEIIKDTPVITISGCRNMWINSQESVKLRLKQIGARLVGNIPLVDRANNHLSVITIFHWLGGGKKDRKWGIFPLPGVSDEDISSAERFGKIAATAFSEQNYDRLQEKFLGLGIIHLPTEIVFIEERAKRIFRIWTSIIKRFGTSPGKRKFFVTAFKYYLLSALFLVAPVLFTLYSILIRPFSGNAIKRKKDYYCSVDLK